MAGIDNLTPFTSKTAPRTGKPKGARNRTTVYRQLLESMRSKRLIDGVWKSPGTNADAIAVALLEKACEGDVSAARELFDGAYGKIAQKVDVKHTNTLEQLSDSELINKLNDLRRKHTPMIESHIVVEVETNKQEAQQLEDKHNNIDNIPTALSNPET